jgi:hypothetical protein
MLRDITGVELDIRSPVYPVRAITARERRLQRGGSRISTALSDARKFSRLTGK